MLRFPVGGVEVDIHPLEPNRDFPRLKELCDQTGLEIGLMSVIEHHHDNTKGELLI